MPVAKGGDHNIKWMKRTKKNEIIKNKKMSPNIPELPGVWYELVLVGSVSSNNPYSKLGLKVRF